MLAESGLSGGMRVGSAGGLDTIVETAGKSACATSGGGRNGIGGEAESEAWGIDGAVEGPDLG